MKQKYEKKTVIDVIGILDKDDNGNLILSVDDEEFDFMEVIKDAVGTEIHLKSEMLEV